jgi:HEAT repeat protein
VYWCFHCYAPNPSPSGPCVRCGREVAAPAGISDEQRLVWTLHHPDSDRAMLAAKTLGVRRASGALPALRQVVAEAFDPYLCAEAVRSAVQIAGVEALADWLGTLAESSESFMVKEAAHGALRGAQGMS